MQEGRENRENIRENGSYQQQLELWTSCSWVAAKWCLFVINEGRSMEYKFSRSLTNI